VRGAARERGDEKAERRKKDEARSDDVASSLTPKRLEGEPPESGTPTSSIMPQTPAEGAAADANNSKSMEKRGENGGDSNGKLPRDKYARAQERKRRKQQRRHERTLARGKK
jgi:hypothetical protein